MSKEQIKNFLSLIKDVYSKLTANVIPDDERLNTLPPKTENNARMSALIIFIHFVLEVFNSTVRCKEHSDLQGKNEVIFYINCMIVQKILKSTFKNSLGIINSASLQYSKLIYNVQFYFYKLVINDWKLKLMIPPKAVLKHKPWTSLVVQWLRICPCSSQLEKVCVRQ